MLKILGVVSLSAAYPLPLTFHTEIVCVFRIFLGCTISQLVSGVEKKQLQKWAFSFLFFQSLVVRRCSDS